MLLVLATGVYVPFSWEFPLAVGDADPLILVSQEKEKKNKRLGENIFKLQI